MSKTLLTQNKEIIIAIGLSTVIFILLLVNLIALGPGMIDLYRVSPAKINKDPIDTAMVNEAIKVLEVK
jgi:hypothetical protein